MISLSFKVLRKPLRFDDALPRTRWWKKIAIREASHIKERTQQDGKGIDNKQFKAYKPEYAKAKKEGRLRTPQGGTYGARSGKVDLTLSGRMLNALFRNIRATKRNAVIGLTGEPAQKAQWMEDQDRAFFGISDDRADAIADDYADALIKGLDD